MMNRFNMATEINDVDFIASDTVTIQLVLFRATLILLALILAVAAAKADPAPGTVPPPGFFPVGVYWQPTGSFDTWKSRGVNTVIGFYDRPDWMAEFQNAAVSRGLWMIRNPQANPAADKTQKYLLAWSHADEPDINGVSTAKLAADYAKWKAADPTRPIIANFSGQNAMYQFDGLTDNLYKQYIKSTDWVSNDVYPITAWNRPDWIDKNAKLNLADPANNNGVPFNPGNSVDKLRDLSGGKKQLAYIETSFQHIGRGTVRGATAAEVRGETWDAIIHGAKGIIYFPQSFAPDKTDGTPKDVAAEMTKTDAKIAEMGAVLNSSSDAASNPITLTGGLEGTWRQYLGKSYFFVLNFSHTAAKNARITLPGLTGKIDVLDEARNLSINSSTFTDTFAPYQLHIYDSTGTSVTSLLHGSQVAVTSVAAVPEPSGGMLLLILAGGILRRRH
jgi:hypothetical protein